jgi:dTDP-4-amino-4,6-dideoxygalactose transaminase
MRTKIRDSYLPFGRPNFGAAEVAAAARVLRSGWIGMGVETLAFERELAEWVQARHVVAVSSCTSALHLALLVSGIKPGDEVICPSLTWCSSANAALYLGARPVFCDIDAGTLGLTPQTMRAKLTLKTRAVVVVHFGGLAADVAALRRALPQRVAIIEDAAHALSAAYPNGRPVGSSGNLVCFSFYPNKNLATAEGGAIALADAAIADRLRSLRQHGLPIDAWKRFTHPKSLLLSARLTELGYKMTFTDLQASIARVQLGRQPEFASRRLAIARLYFRRLSGLHPSLKFQDEVCAARHARHLFTIQLPAGCGRLARDKLLLALRKRKIGATIHYAPLHRMPLYGAHGRSVLPVTENVCDRIITLPISSSMSPADAGYVAEHVIDLLG